MFAKELKTMSSRNRVKFYELFGDNKNVIADLLKGELEVAETFERNYSTPELRKIAAKAKRAGDTETLDSLPKDSMKFTGRLTTGDVIEDQKAIDTINSYLESTSIISQDLPTLVAKSDGTTNSGSTAIILGRELHYWNLHPNSLDEAIYGYLFRQPQYVVSEIEKLVMIKLNTSKEVVEEKVFTDERELTHLLYKLEATEEELEVLRHKLMKVTYTGILPKDEFKATLEKALVMFMESDNSFDLEIYKNIRGSLPQYNNQKTKYFVTLLNQYSVSTSTELNRLINFRSLYAYYRKAVELCS